MGLKQHQHFKNLQEHSFQKIVTIFLIPVILPGGDKLSKVSDENLTMPKPKTTTKKQSNLPPPLTIKQSNVNTQDLTHRCTGCAVWVWVFFPPNLAHTQPNQTCRYFHTLFVPPQASHLLLLLQNCTAELLTAIYITTTTTQSSATTLHHLT